MLVTNRDTNRVTSYPQFSLLVLALRAEAWRVRGLYEHTRGAVDCFGCVALWALAWGPAFGFSSVYGSLLLAFCWSVQVS